MRLKNRCLNLILLWGLLVGSTALAPMAVPDVTLAQTRHDVAADGQTVARVGINGVACSFVSLQDAVNAANSGDVIQAATGTFEETVQISNKDLTIVGGYNADCVTYPTNPTNDPTIVDASSSSGTVFDVSESTVTLRRLVLTGGNGSAGGGLHATSSSDVTLEDSFVVANQALDGGGIFVRGSAVVTLHNTWVWGNTARNVGGGARVWGRLEVRSGTEFTQNTARHGGGISVSGGTLYIDDGRLGLNTAFDDVGRGGGIQVENSGVITLTNGVAVYSNSAYDGGGIHAWSSHLFMEDTTVTTNEATNDGGGIFLTEGSVLSSTGYTVVGDSVNGGNEARYGGGIYAEDSTVDFYGRISGNRARRGGGLYASSSTINLTDSLVGGEEAPNELRELGAYGAGIWLDTDINATLHNTTVSHNRFTAAELASSGGGLYIAGNGVITMTASTVSDHVAPSSTAGRGAGVSMSGSPLTLTLDGTEISRNTAGTQGGGIDLVSGATLNVLNGSEISDNHALGSMGGGIYAKDALVFIDASVLRDNSAATSGGAVSVSNGGLEAINSVFQDNRAGSHGGALAAYSSEVSMGVRFVGDPPGGIPVELCDPRVRRCSALSGNVANTASGTRGNGGAIYANESVLEIAHTYLNHNSAFRGGAIYQTGADAEADLSNSLIYGNSAVFGAGIERARGTFDLTHVTLVDNMGDAGFLGVARTVYNSIAWGNDGHNGFSHAPVSSACNIDEGGNAGLDINPRFVSPGAGQNYRLQSSSPAVDACVTGLPLDLDNVERPRGEGYDMGAFEHGGTVVYLPLSLKR